MRKFKYTFYTLLSVLFLSSCIKSEEPNSEADIISCFIVEDGLNGEHLILKTDPMINNNAKGNFTIKLILKENADIKRITPIFTVTEGAKTVLLTREGTYIDYPESGMTLDFTTDQKIGVISEDGNWAKLYTMSASQIDLPLKFSFENMRIQHPTSKNSYCEFYELNDLGNESMTWASGNPGYSLTGSNKGPEDFPTQQDPNGLKGACVKMITLSTGTFGATVNKPIAAGNLFLGEFITTDALTTPLKATKFGLPFTEIPKRLIGYYKYKRGPVFTEGKKANPDKKDIGDIYAIFYETDATFQTLDGTNQFSDSHIVSIARIGDSEMKETDEWTKFDLSFIDKPGKFVDLKKLSEGYYKLAIVFSSSKEGDLFNGAVGSTLMIDEVEIKIKE